MINDSPLPDKNFKSYLYHSRHCSKLESIRKFPNITFCLNSLSKNAEKLTGLIFDSGHIIKKCESRRPTEYYWH